MLERSHVNYFISYINKKFKKLVWSNQVDNYGDSIWMDGWMDGGGGSGWDDLIDRQTDRQTGRYGCDLVGPVLVTHFEDKLSTYVLIINRCGYEFIF